MTIHPSIHPLLSIQSIIHPSIHPSMHSSIHSSISSFIHSFINHRYTGWMCRDLISATSYTLVGVVNKFITILLNVLVWGELFNDSTNYHNYNYWVYEVLTIPTQFINCHHHHYHHHHLYHLYNYHHHKYHHIYMYRQAFKCLGHSICLCLLGCWKHVWTGTTEDRSSDELSSRDSKQHYNDDN